tara:strand:+ start:381 stop:1253 length:873 start_codon:yes stop_codon:yes gene_type:complete
MKKRISFEQIDKLNPDWVQSKIVGFIEEDAPSEDITTKYTIPKDLITKANMIAAEDFVFCGEEFIPFCFSKSCSVELFINDGQNVSSGQILAQIDGDAQSILTYERVALNLTQRLCGITTETRKFCDLNFPKGFMVMDTRKMTPGLRRFEKYAVKVGGGWNHRLDLSSAILIKDNHIQAAGSIKAAINQIKNGSSLTLPIELEVDNLEQLKEGLNLNLDGFLLDNMNEQTVSKAVSMIRDKKDGEEIFIEASGGINYDTIESYAWLGVDGVSMSAITANAPVVDIKLEII